MAHFVPSLQETRSRPKWLNTGELRVLDALAGLGDGWSVYVQPRLGMDIPDFVALHDGYGVCAIEVKDWAYNKYRNENGVVQRRCSAGWTAVDEHPRLQASRYRSSIFENSFALPEDGRIVPPCVRSIVVLLNHPSKQANEVLRRAARAPGERVAVWGEQFFDAIEEALVGTAPASPPADSMSKLRTHLESATYVSRLLAPEPLSEGAANIAKNPNGAKMRRVRGSAGCGKSYGLAARAAALAAAGESVLLLTFNVTLANYLRKLVARHCSANGADPTRVTCVHLHGFCSRIVDDARAKGLELTVPDDADNADLVIHQAMSATEQGVRLRFDAILVDEGQDFRLDWWNLLRKQVKPAGEMLLVADPTQNIYGQDSWTDEAHMLGAGFSGPWTDLGHSYRLPRDMVATIATFGRQFVGGEVIGPVPRPTSGALPFSDAPTEKRWINVKSARDIPDKAARFAHELASGANRLDPSEIVVLCESHDQGLRVVRELERHGHDVHHIFAKDKDERKRRKQRFWPDAPGIKACTIHSFKGWESRAVVLCVGSSKESKRLAYVAMTRLAADSNGRRSYIAVVNANRGLDAFRDTFKGEPPPRTSPTSRSFPPPAPDDRVA